MRTDFKAIALTGALAFAALMLPPLHAGDGLSWRHPAAIAQASQTPEKAAFEAAKELGTVEAWDAFLSNYPTGFHADLARAYVKKLAGSAPPPPAAVPSKTSESLKSAFELPCKEAAKLRSETSKDPVKIRFINDSGATLVLQWIDFKGAIIEFGEVKPGEEVTQDTFITHPWIAAYQEGSCRQLFLPEDGLSIARLLPEDQVRAAQALRQSSTRKTSRADEFDDHGPTPEQTCKNIGQDYDGVQCVPRKSVKPSSAVIERRARAACVNIGMIYLNGKCAPKTRAERQRAEKSKNKACPAGMYRNPYGKCQPNETGG